MDESGNFGPVDITLGGLRAALEQVFRNRGSKAARKTGRLTELIDSHMRSGDGKFASAKLCIALMTTDAARGVDLTSSRQIVEDAILGQLDGCFHNNFHPLVDTNGMKTTADALEQLGILTIDTYIKHGLVRATDTVIDVGTGSGYVPRYLESRGFEVSAIEPGEHSDPHQLVFAGTEQLSAQAFNEAYPGLQFSVVHAGNFSPFTKSMHYRVQDAAELTHELSRMTSPGGRALVGISSMDPYLISPTSKYWLKPVLEKFFGMVRFLSFLDLGCEFSIGGQLGVYECLGPKSFVR